MPVMQGRLVLALGFSSAAHIGLGWMLSDALPSTAAPAQRALTVAMTPAAPRAVLNSIAPSATAALSPAQARPLEPSTVPVVDEPDAIVAARVVDTVALLDAAPVETRGPEHALRARATPRAPPAPAREAVENDAGSGREARAAPSVAGQPGTDRSALPAAGNAPPDYPWTARARGHQGRVVLSVWVSAAGLAERLAVLHSSGYASLDRAAMEAVERWRFRPARRAGHDADSLVYVPVVFRLED